MVSNSLAGRKNTIGGALGSAAQGCVSGLVGFGVAGLVGKAVGVMVRTAGAAIARTVAAMAPKAVASAMNQPVINLTWKALEHIAEGHVPGGSATAGNSVFNAGEDILGLLRAAEGQAPVFQARTGNLIRVVDAGRVVGVSKEGADLSVYTVVTTVAGTLKTIFPGVPAP
jgi:hypothetical protein